MLYQNLIKPALFSLDPELAHELGGNILHLASKCRPLCFALRKFLHNTNNPVSAFGLKFPNCIGQAAGLDKNGLFPAVSESLGFGFTEVGTVTPLPQKGNEKPRLFRIPKHLALVNRMGFNNEGVKELRARIIRSYPKTRRHTPLGINLGKGKSTPLERAIDDYCMGFDHVAPIADYITINISSPNTPDLRDLQNDKLLDPLLSGIQAHRGQWSKANKIKSPPCLLKISPDETFKSIETIVSKAIEYEMDGIIACNTSIKPTVQFQKIPNLPKGGISGKPIESKANQVIKFVSKLTGYSLPIIGSGGVYDYESAQRKLDAGACLLQIYTSFVYKGPFWPSRLARRIPLAKSFY